MMKYVCMNCGEILDEDELDHIVERDTGEGGYGGVMWQTDVCPHCGEESIEEAKKCPICGEYHGKDDLFCADCEDMIKRQWETLLKAIYGDDYTDEDACEVARYIGEVIV